MKRNQWILSLVGIVLFSTLFFFGKTVSPKKNISKTEQHSPDDGHGHSISFDELLIKAKEKLTDEKKQFVGVLENSINSSATAEQIKIFKQLATFWKDTARVFEPYAYYTSEAAKLENSEKSLTFAAQLFIDNLFDETNPSMQNWLASNGKVLLEKALIINPNNDSSKIGLGACYMLGNISDNPMQGIVAVKTVADKNPNNMYAQWVLALGGKKSGQYDKAAERFLLIVQKQPTNLIAMLHLAECYELNNNKAEAIKWYKTVQSIIPNPEAKKELQQRIEQLQK